MALEAEKFKSFVLEIRNLFEAAEAGLPPFHSQLFEDMSEEDLDALVEAVGGRKPFWVSPKEMCAPLYGFANCTTEFIDERGRRQAAEIIRAIQCLPKDVSRTSVFFVSALAHKINAPKAILIERIRSLDNVERVSSSWLDGVINGIAALHDAAVEAEKEKDVDTYLALQPSKLVKRAAGRSIVDSDLLSALAEIRDTLESNADDIRSHANLNVAINAVEAGLAPRNLRQDHLAPLVYEQFEAAVTLIGKTRQRISVRQQAEIVFRAWGIEITMEAAKRNRMRSR